MKINIKKLASVIGVLWVVSGIASFLMRDPVSLSEDQKDLVASFGYPDTFTLMMDSETRYETWAYYIMNKAFSFIDGSFLEEIEMSEIDNESMVFTEFKPTQFKNGLLFADIGKILGEPNKKGDIDPDLLENAEIYNYSDQVIVGVQNDQVIYVQTLPALTSAE